MLCVFIDIRPSRVGAAIDPMMEGLEQLDTVITFRDDGSGVARELQRAASRAQSSRSERNLLQAFRDISSWCDQFSLPHFLFDVKRSPWLDAFVSRSSICLGCAGEPVARVRLCRFFGFSSTSIASTRPRLFDRRDHPQVHGVSSRPSFPASLPRRSPDDSVGFFGSLVIRLELW